MNFFTSETPNTKLTIEQRELLICLMEEASEVSQVIAKILRFGYTSSPLLSEVTNAQRLQCEVAEFLGIVDRLIELKLFSAVALDEGAEAKLLKLENYLLFKGDTDTV